VGNGGTGLHSYGATLTLERCRFERNDVSGLDIFTGSRPTIVDCVFTDNLGEGVSFGPEVEGTMRGCLVEGNLATGIGCDADPTVTIEDCTIVKNQGPGLSTDDYSAPTLVNCTIAGNSRGIALSAYRAVTLKNCIVWDNLVGSIYANDQMDALAITYSCIEGETVPSGPGNTNENPRFCGWGSQSESYVDAAAPGPGDGTKANPYPRLAEALDFSFALAADSPCIGAGEGNVTMGASHGLCADAGVPARIVNLAAGSYTMQGETLVFHTSLRGDGESATVVAGNMPGLRTGASLSYLTATRALNGFYILGGQRPELIHVTVTGNSWGGVAVWGASPILTACTIAGNGSSGISIWDGSADLTNCAVFGNELGVYCSNAALTMTNCTVTGNRAEASRGAGVVCEGSSTASLTNCIVWGNQPQKVPAEGLIQCLVDQDPRFVRNGVFDFARTVEQDMGGFSYEFPDFIVEQPDLRLAEGSPAIDAGAAAGAPASDIEGNARPFGPAIDIGAYEYVPCSAAGDAHCLGLDVSGPEVGGPGTYVATASAQDDSGDSITYTFSAKRGDEAPIVMGPQAGNTASLDIAEGTWTIIVRVDDDPKCSDAADAACAVTVEVRPLGALQRPGDMNQDGKLNLSDAVWLLGHLFLGTQPTLPCEGGTPSNEGAGDLALADVNGDGGIDLSDPVSILGFLFLGGKPPALGTGCVRIVGCPDGCQ
jgi:hypothetical protein